MSQYPIEALLRPPVELWSALTTGAVAMVVAIEPGALMLPPAAGYAVAATLAALALRRAGQGWRILRYHRGLRRLPSYRLRADQIPCSQSRLFLGRGFRWRQQHTQRLRDTARPDARRYVDPGAFYQFARRTETDWEHQAALKYVARVLATDAWWNPARPLPPVGGKPALHAVEPDEQEVWMPIHERVGHTLVLGTTRVGKTRLAEILIAQDIRRGDVVIVFDPKGDAGLMKRVVAEARRAGRENATYVFHLGYPDISARYNPVANFSRVSEIATRVANQLPSQGNSAAFREFAWRFTNIVGSALYAMGRRPTYALITHYITNMDQLFVEYCRHWLAEAAPGWEADVSERAQHINDRELPPAMRGRSKEVVALTQFIRDHDLYDSVADGLLSATQYDRTYFDKITASLLPLMEKLTSGKIGELISPNYGDTDDPRPIFDWMQIVRRKGIVYVGLDALSDFAVSSAVGNSMFADLAAVSGHIYKHGVDGGLPDQGTGKPQLPVVSIHADEFNELIGDEFIPLVNKGGGSGLQITAYTQTWSDIQAKLGDSAKAGQVTGNFNTLIMLRVKELATAELLTDQLDTVHVATLTSVTGVTDASDPTSEVDFTSRNEDRLSVTDAPMLMPADLMALPKGQAFALMEGGQLWKLRFPLPDAARDAAMPDNLQQVAEAMTRKYTTADSWWVTANPPLTLRGGDRRGRD